MKTLIRVLIALALAAGLIAGLSGCDTECAGHGGWYSLQRGIFYCNDGTLDYG